MDSFMKGLVKHYSTVTPPEIAKGVLNCIKLKLLTYKEADELISYLPLQFCDNCGCIMTTHCPYCGLTVK